MVLPVILFYALPLFLLLALFFRPGTAQSAHSCAWLLPPAHAVPRPSSGARPPTAARSPQARAAADTCLKPFLRLRDASLCGSFFDIGVNPSRFGLTPFIAARLSKTIYQKTGCTEALTRLYNRYQYVAITTNGNLVIARHDVTWRHIGRNRCQLFSTPKFACG